MAFSDFLKEKSDFLITENEEDKFIYFFLLACLAAAKNDIKIVKSNPNVKNFIKQLITFEDNYKELIGKKLEFAKDADIIGLVSLFKYENITLEQILQLYLKNAKYFIESTLAKINFKTYLEIDKLMDLLFNEKTIADILSELNTDKSLINKKDINTDLTKI